jgi:hypothetical protein
VRTNMAMKRIGFSKPFDLPFVLPKTILAEVILYSFLHFPGLQK